MTERIINAERVEQLIDVFGSFDANIKQIEAEFGVKVTNRDTELKIQGDVEQADYAARAIEALLSLSAKGEEIDAQKVRVARLYALYSLSPTLQLAVSSHSPACSP